MSIFIKMKKKGNVEEQGFMETPVNRFTESIEKRKLRVAGWLRKKTAGYSPARKKIGLFIFCIFFGGLSIYILASSVHGHSFNTRSLLLMHFNSGVHDPDYSPVNDSILRKAKKIKLWMDSVRKKDTVRFKAIMLAEPFLLERLNMMEKLYDPQTK
jgi:hypothetical protein